MYEKTIIVPEGVTEILSKQFEGRSNLEKINLPKSLKSIGKEAFIGCVSLETIEIPEGVTEIKEKAFEYCRNLKKINLPKSLKSIDKEAFVGCGSLETIEIPEGVTEIKEETFGHCLDLKKIKLPDTITKIKAKAFKKCQRLKKINLPDSLQSIDYAAFNNCESLEEINIPDSVTNICGHHFYYMADYYGACFEYCFKLKQVKLSNNIEIIPRNCFNHCKSLEKVILPSKLKIIESEAFRKCTSLKNIVIPNGVQEIHIDAFSECESLKKLVIPSSVTKIDRLAFTNCTNLKNITLNYESLETLADFIIKNEDFFETNPHVSVTFAGPKLGFKEKARIILYLKRSIEFKEGQVPIIIPEYTPITTTNLDEDIKKIIDEINEICSKLPEKNKEEITKQVTELLDEYNSNKEKFKPKFDLEENISLNIGTISLLKPRLLSSLNMIKLNLASEKKLIKFLSDLEKYKKLLTEDINELSNNDSIEEKIKNIVYYTKFIDKDKRIEYLTKLKEYIDIEIKNSNNKIGKNNNKEIELNTKYEEDYEEEFRLNVLRLYDDISAYASKISPYIKLLNTITTKEEINKPNLDDNTLTGLINGIKYIINNLSDSRYQDKLEEKYNEFTNKYSKIIEELLNEPNNLNQTKYEELERNIREELQPLLEQIRNYITLEEYENNNANNTNLLNQLYTCKDIIEAKEKVTPTKEQNKEVLTSTIIDINNDLLHVTVLDSISKNTIREELSNIIDKHIKRLNKKLIYNLKEYNIVTREILTEFIDIQLKVERYIKEVEEYNKYIK